MYPLSPWRIVISNLFTKYRGIVRFTWPCFVKRLSEKINKIPVETTFCTPVVVSYSPSSHCKIPVNIIIISPSRKAAHNSNHQLILIVVYFPISAYPRWWFSNIYFLFSPRSLGKWSNLTSIFFRWVVQPPTSIVLLMVQKSCTCRYAKCPFIYQGFYTSKWRSPDFWTINGITFDARGCFPTTNMPSP